MFLALTLEVPLLSANSTIRNGRRHFSSTTWNGADSFRVPRPLLKLCPIQRRTPETSVRLQRQSTFRALHRCLRTYCLPIAQEALPRRESCRAHRSPETLFLPV